MGRHSKLTREVEDALIAGLRGGQSLRTLTELLDVSEATVYRHLASDDPRDFQRDLGERRRRSYHLANRGR